MFGLPSRSSPTTPKVAVALSAQLDFAALLQIVDAAAARKARQNTTIASVGVLLPILFLSVLTVIRAKAALANASTGIGLLRLGMEHRHRRTKNGRSKNAGLRTAMSVATVHNSGVPWLGCWKTHRENASSLRAQRSEAKQSSLRP
jgi:hypothetical protein